MSDKAKVFAILGVAVLLAAVGEALAAKGMKQAGEQSGLMAQLSAALKDWHVLTGAGLMVGYVALYVYALGLTDLSLALPLSAGSYGLGLLFSKYYLDEDIKLPRLIGTLVIIGGVLIVGIAGAKDSGGEKDKKGGDSSSQSHQLNAG